jgi:rare lipoprotein A
MEATSSSSSRHAYSGENTSHPPVILKKGSGSVDPKIQPYSVMGKTYWPVQSALGFREEGYASWYGMDFHGKKTATGETYDMFGVSAAHKTLPLGSKVRVHNLNNGRTLDLVINDRGPFVDGRVIDLSYASARLLGMADTGLAHVRVEGLEENPNLADARGTKSSRGAQVAQATRVQQPRRGSTFTESDIREETPRQRPAQTAQATTKSRPAQVAATKPAPASTNSMQASTHNSGKYAVQVGAFSQDENARRVHAKLVQAGFGGAKITRTERDGKQLLVVQAGSYEERDSAEEALRSLKQEFPASFISSGA